ncbi:MAG: DUF4167 domain-containing protein [Alphaproteobacteria bacterium]|nr:DUF4167 domain-containing protein [Alphaproteobacteria bacterium]
MRQNAPQRRGRGRPTGRRGFNNSPNRSYDSNGPEVKVRGTASAVYDKYQTLGRDSLLSGDRVAAENYFQHAEHYYRLMQAAKQQAGESEQRDVRRQEQQNQDERGNDRDAGDNDKQSTAASEEAVVEVAGDSSERGTDSADAVVIEDTRVGRAAVDEANAPQRDEVRAAPMNPAELAAMSESGRIPRAGSSNGVNGRDNENRGGDAPENSGAETVEAAPRRQPRRRRRPAADTATAESDSAPLNVVEDTEPS